MEIPLQVRIVDQGGAWQTATIATEFPMSSTGAKAIRSMIRRLLFDAARPGQVTLYANTNHIHKDDLWKEFSRNGAAWQPSMGVGVFPDDPPRLMRPEDFYNHELGQKMRSMLDPLLAIAPAETPRTVDVFDKIAGYGNTMAVVSRLDAGTLASQMTGHTLPLVEDESFRSFPLYVPMLNGRNAGMISTSPHVHQALAGVDLYFRECAEENTLFVAVRGSAAVEFEKAGLRHDAAKRLWTLTT